MKKKLYYIFCVLIIPHLILYILASKTTRELIDSDVTEMNKRTKSSKSLGFYLFVYPQYRNLFYYRIGRRSIFVRWYLKPYPLFSISSRSFGRNAFVLNHPYGTIINAKSVGDNFTICQLTTIGNAMHGQKDLIPTIGNRVSIGANVSIIGNITIGNNVIIGAGSIVVKDVPDNCVVAGVPARIIRYLD